MSGSFFLIPSSTEASVLKKENTLLKTELDSLKKRLESTDRVYDKLRDSIYLATKEVGIIHYLITNVTITRLNEQLEAVLSVLASNLVQ